MSRWESLAKMKLTDEGHCIVAETSSYLVGAQAKALGMLCIAAIFPQPHCFH